MAQRITALVLIIKILFLVKYVSQIARTAAANDGYKIQVVGKVMCKDCTEGWNEWTKGSKPIKGAVVSITCIDKRRGKRYDGSDITDERGQYNHIVDKVLFGGKNLKPHLCTVRLESSPDQLCNIPIGDGQTGEKLVGPFRVFKDTVKFVVGPFYYTTPMCNDPEI